MVSNDDGGVWIDDQGRRVVRHLASERAILGAVNTAWWFRWYRLLQLSPDGRSLAMNLLSARRCAFCQGNCPKCGYPLVPEVKTIDVVAADGFVCSRPDCSYRRSAQWHGPVI